MSSVSTTRLNSESREHFIPSHRLSSQVKKHRWVDSRRVQTTRKLSSISLLTSSKCSTSKVVARLNLLTPKCQLCRPRLRCSPSSNHLPQWCSHPCEPRQRPASPKSASSQCQELVCSSRQSSCKRTTRLRSRSSSNKPFHSTSNRQSILLKASSSPPSSSRCWRRCSSSRCSLCRWRPCPRSHSSKFHISSNRNSIHSSPRRGLLSKCSLQPMRHLPLITNRYHPPITLALARVGIPFLVSPPRPLLWCRKKVVV